jgi:hypothetical protein
MKIVAAMSLLALMTCPTTALVAATVNHAHKPVSKETSATCTKLSDDYEDVSKALAANAADDALDNSAIRSTMRQTQNSTAMEQARMTLELMRSNNCKIPTAAPTAKRYLVAALTCKNAQATRRSDVAWGKSSDTSSPIPECYRSTWKPNAE